MNDSDSRKTNSEGTSIPDMEQIEEAVWIKMRYFVAVYYLCSNEHGSTLVKLSHPARMNNTLQLILYRTYE